MVDVWTLNREGWDRLVQEHDRWTLPVSQAEVDRARQGDWSLFLTPTRPVPPHWLGAVAGRDVLCLASGGGQQGPILAAAGASVTVFDASPRQLAQDAMVAGRDGLSLRTCLGLMHDLSRFPDRCFDLVVHPASNCFTPEIEPVWSECWRVLRPGGVLASGFMNPDTYIFDKTAEARGELVVRFTLPYADLTDLPPDELRHMIETEHVVEYSHSLEKQIGGQLRADFVLTDFYEDRWDGWAELGISRYIPTLFATRAVKPVAAAGQD